MSLSCNSLVALPWRGRGLARSGGGGTCSIGLSALPAWWKSVWESLPRREVRAGSCLWREAVAVARKLPGTAGYRVFGRGRRRAACWREKACGRIVE